MYFQARTFLTSKGWFSYFPLFLLLQGILSYNIDTDNVRIFNYSRTQDHRRGSYFGFSVALFASGSNFAVLVGAPRANSSASVNAIEPGSVYVCSSDKICNEWTLDLTGKNRQFRLLGEIKDNAWIGATLAVENKTHPMIVVCGPRWKHVITIGNKQFWFMNGICYSTAASGLDSFKTEAQNVISPLISSNQQIVSTASGVGYYQFGMGQAGFSLHMTSNEIRSDLVLGSPGIYNWKGSPLLISKTLGGNMQTVIPRIADESLIRGGDYFGYAVTSGCYFKKNDTWFASGAPRSTDIQGSVLIFAFPNHSNVRLITKSVVEGEQRGEYFGAVLASCDLNNDGRDELIVGAPLWSRDVDEGRVYVFSARHNEHLEMQSYEGEVPGGRFGTSIMCLGDIDFDGYADLAVGAPYEDNTGAIYIFNGNSINELGKKYSQKIIGSQFGQGVRGFGISISEPRDINGDHYSDLAVGAYLSEQVILLKSKPVVSITAKLTHAKTKRLLRNSTSATVELCAVYDGAYAPPTLQVIRLLKVDPMFGRAMYNGDKVSDNTYQLPDILRRSVTSCERLNIKLKDKIQNVIDPIEISASVVLAEPEKLRTGEKEDSFKYKTCVVINKFSSKAEDSIKLPFAVDCGDDDICISDIGVTLSINLPPDNKYIIGSAPTVKLTVQVVNNGEPAYQTKVNVYIPEILSLASVPPACMEESRHDGTFQVICDVGNPLRSNRTITLEVDLSEVRYDTDSVKILANVSTQSEERNTFDDSQSLTMYFDVDMDVAIAGKAQEDLYSYGEREGEEQMKIIRFQHIYEVQKFGASSIEEAVLKVDVPCYWEHWTGDIAIVNINQANGFVDGRAFYCDITNSTESSTRPLPHNSGSNTPLLREHIHDRLIVEEEIPLMHLPAENRSLFINCTNANIKCKRLDCKLGSLESSLSVAILTLTLDLQLHNFKSDIMDEKDIVYFVSEGAVSITQPRNVIQKVGHKPDHCNIATMFVGSPVAQHVAMWILILSVFLGILLLILLALGLIKLGFFNRKKKEELEALKAESDICHEDIALETTSSQRALNQE